MKPAPTDPIRLSRPTLAPPPRVFIDPDYPQPVGHLYRVFDLTRFNRRTAMSEKLIAAVTPATSPYPPYLNVTDCGDGTVRVTLRGNPRGEECGYTHSAIFPASAWVDFERQIKDGGWHPSSLAVKGVAAEIAR